VSASRHTGFCRYVTILLTTNYVTMAATAPSANVTKRGLRHDIQIKSGKVQPEISKLTVSAPMTVPDWIGATRGGDASTPIPSRISWPAGVGHHGRVAHHSIAHRHFLCLVDHQHVELFLSSLQLEA